MKMVEQNDEADKEENNSNEKEERDNGHDLRNMPLLQAVNAVLAAAADFA